MCSGFVREVTPADGTLCWNLLDRNRSALDFRPGWGTEGDSGGLGGTRGGLRGPFWKCDGCVLMDMQ